MLRYLREDVGARASILVAAILFDLIALGAFLFIKATADPMIVVIAIGSMAAIFAFEALYLGRIRDKEAPDHAHSHS